MGKPATPESAEPTIENGLYILNSASFSGVVDKGDTFIKFYAPWCGHCQKLAPVWDELAKSFEKDEQVKIAKLDCTQQQSLCQEHEVKGYPTLAYFRNGRKVETYKGARTLAELTDFVNTEKGEAGKDADQDGKVPEPKTASPVTKLDKNNFEAETKSGVAFVKFFAPWCGHCKRLAPTWEELAAKMNKDVEMDVTIAKVDCTEATALCSAQDVTGYPTLKFFKNGAEKDDGVKYRGQRDLAALEKFINEKLGNEIPEEKPATPESAEPTIENGLYILNSASFSGVVDKGDTFIKFYAPWCGHCQKLAPVWDELAKSFEKDEQVKNCNWIVPNNKVFVKSMKSGDILPWHTLEMEGRSRHTKEQEPLLS